MHFFTLIIKNLATWGISVVYFGVAILEFGFGLYVGRWKKNEKFVDIGSYVIVTFFLRLIKINFLLLFLLPLVVPQYKNTFAWVPMGWGVLLVIVISDFAEYWFHRWHHEKEWLWKFHRTHHSAQYMGMVMANRNSLIQNILFPQIYLTATLIFLGLGPTTIVVGVIKALITYMAHSSIRWDRPLYKYRILNPLAWLLERTISLPATHHAHHAAHDRDGIGHYMGNYGNVFLIWDVIFGTAKITRKYPDEYGIEGSAEDPWYAQIFYPMLKSKESGTDLS